MPEPETRRRRRPAVSCTLCRKRKIRCNREFPCSNCMRSKSGTCNYESYPPLGHHRPATEETSSAQDVQQQEEEGEGEIEPPSLLSGHFLLSSQEDTASPANLLAASKKATASLAGESSAGASTLVGHPSPQDLQNKIKQLEEQLAALKPPGPRTPVREPQLLLNSAVGGILHTLSGDVVVRASQLFGQVKTTTYGIVHKRRLFGQTHWMSSIILLREIIEMLEPHLYTGELKAADMVQKCKVLARIIKKDRTPLWPAIPTTDLPPKEVADELVDNYMRTIEIQYRILHIPTFRKMYEAVWVSGAERDKDFMVQLNLVLAIGATTYDDNFSMRTSAIRWVYEAQTWRSAPHMKHRLKLQTLQTEILQILAQEMVGVDGALTWIGIGSLLRTALYMGLHRDPARLLKRGVLNAEMRRRIFNTILELVLGTSMTSGGPPLISVEDFDTDPPGNYDDEQLLEDDPTPKPSDVLTDTSAAIALRKSFPLRLGILKYLNNTGSQNSYEESLKLDAELREAYKTLRKAVQPPASSENGLCTVRVLDLLMNRYLMALHFPYYNLALQSSTFAYTRTALIDASVKAWRAVFPDSSRASFGGPETAAAAREANKGRSFDLLRRLTVCASGFFRTIFHQCAIAVAAELAAQVREGESLGPVTLRPDLLDMLACARDFFFRGVEAGDTSVKGYMVMCIASEPVRCYLDGRGREELPQRILCAAEESIARCLPLLEERAAAIKARPAGGSAGLGPDGIADPLAMETPGGTMDNWDFMMPGMEIDPEMNSDPMNWLFADIETAGSMVW